MILRGRRLPRCPLKFLSDAQSSLRDLDGYRLWSYRIFMNIYIYFGCFFIFHHHKKNKKQRHESIDEGLPWCCLESSICCAKKYTSQFFGILCFGIDVDCWGTRRKRQASFLRKIHRSQSFTICSVILYIWELFCSDLLDFNFLLHTIEGLFGNTASCGWQQGNSLVVTHV